MATYQKAIKQLVVGYISSEKIPVLQSVLPALITGLTEKFLRYFDLTEKANQEIPKDEDTQRYSNFIKQFLAQYFKLNYVEKNNEKKLASIARKINEETAVLLKLPGDVLAEVCSYLVPSELYHLEETSKQIREILPTKKPIQATWSFYAELLGEDRRPKKELHLPHKDTKIKLLPFHPHPPFHPLIIIYLTQWVEENAERWFTRLRHKYIHNIERWRRPAGFFQAKSQSNVVRVNTTTIPSEKQQFMQVFNTKARDLSKEKKKIYMEISHLIAAGKVEHLNTRLKELGLSGKQDFWFIQDSDGVCLYQYIHPGNQAMLDRLFADMYVSLAKKPFLPHPNNSTEYDRYSLLYWAFYCKQKGEVIVKVVDLCKKQADSIDIKLQQDYILLSYACRFERLKAVGHILDTMIKSQGPDYVANILAKRDAFGTSILFKTIFYGQANVLRCLLDKLNDPVINSVIPKVEYQTNNASGKITLAGYELQHLAAAFSADCLQVLINEKVDLTRLLQERPRSSTLSIACQWGNVAAVAMILAHLKSQENFLQFINQRDENEGRALGYAQDPRIVKLLLDNQANRLAPHNKELPIHHACRRGDLASVALLLQDQPDSQINEPNSADDTPLSLAAYSGHEPIVAYLLLKGADASHESTTLVTQQGSSIDAIIRSFSNSKMTNEDKEEWIEVLNRLYIAPALQKEVDTAIGCNAEVMNLFDQQCQQIKLPNGLTWQAAPPDGHCFFHAMREYLPANSIVDLRQAVVAHLSDNRTSYEEFYADKSQGFDHYLTALAANAWADQLVIQAMVEIYHRPIVVFRPNGDPVIHDQGCPENEQPIFVIFNGHNHYDIARLADGADALTIFNELKTQQAAEAQQRSLCSPSR